MPREPRAEEEPGPVDARELVASSGSNGAATASDASKVRGATCGPIGTSRPIANQRVG